MLRRTLKWISVVTVIIVAAVTALITADIPADELEKKYATAPSKFINLDNMRIHYRDQGHGPVLMLIHGSNASLFTWEGWVQELKSDFRIITLDLPGHGLTGPDPDARYDWLSMAEKVNMLADKLAIDRFSIAGNSMGGAVAWTYAVTYPNTVDKLILVDSAGYPREEARPLAIRAFGMPGIGHLMTKISARIAVKKNIEDVYGDSSKVRNETVTLYHEMLLRTGNREASRRRLSAPPDEQLYQKIKTIHIPTLILWGGRDRWILPKYAYRFAADIQNAALIFYDDLGHIPMEEAPKRTAQDVRNFLLETKSNVQ